ncbi:MAG: PIG-L deacetylase family protein [Terriglobia bacterium]
MTSHPSLTVLTVFAHPDDAEFLCGGTLACLAARGAAIHITSMTAGDCGSDRLPAARISRIRRAEAAKAAALIGASYVCLGEKDLCIFYSRPPLQEVMEQVRRVKPDLVFTHPPADYMVDHETTSRLCQTACFGAMAPNFRTAARRCAPAIGAVPPLYYTEPFGGRDILGRESVPGLFVNIAETLEMKEKMIACHQSQRAWLSAQQEIADTSSMGRKMAARVGRMAGIEWAEGFFQHLGQGFPQENILKNWLGGLVRVGGKAGANQLPDFGRRNRA